ncbi:hypothetical protein D3C80_1507690 [compost metagenome]
MRLQLALLIIQRNERFAGFCHTYINSAAWNAVRIECVERLTVFKHNEVRHIDHVIDWANPSRHQAVLQPLRRSGYLHIFNVPCRIMGALLGSADCNRDMTISANSCIMYTVIRQADLTAG